MKREIIDPESRELTSFVQQFLNHWQALGDQVKQEILQSQVEVGTRVCRTTGEAREEAVRKVVDHLVAETQRALQ